VFSETTDFFYIMKGSLWSIGLHPFMTTILYPLVLWEYIRLPLLILLDLTRRYCTLIGNVNYREDFSYVSVTHTLLAGCINFLKKQGLNFALPSKTRFVVSFRFIEIFI